MPFVMPNDGYSFIRLQTKDAMLAAAQNKWIHVFDFNSVLHFLKSSEPAACETSCVSPAKSISRETKNDDILGSVTAA
jgi:hypothetical protein